MKFYVKDYNSKPRELYVYPCFVLITNNWDDFGYSTTFTLNYYDKNEVRTQIGSLRIMDIRNEESRGTTVLENSFDSLDENYCSLGYNVEYYKKFSTVNFPINAIEVLDALNDAACMPLIRDRFEDTRAFQSSLLREREAKTALQLGDRIVKKIQLDQEITFQFSTKLQNAESEHVVNFSFDKSYDLQRRIFAIIGKNGTGKTQFISNLANALSFVRKEYLPKKIKKNQIKLEDHETGRFNTELGPPFGKVIAISYSLFDNFKRPEPTKQFSYIYCGLRDEKDNINRALLIQRHLASLKELNRKNRVDFWLGVISSFIDNTNALGYEFDSHGSKIQNIEQINSLDILSLSSGHSMLIYTITELIANVTEDSLILFDEPENHLHPNAIANLINVLNEITKRFDSFAIVSTHSPIVVQEIPSKNIYVFERDGNIPITRPLDIESYGENLTVITKHIFETVEVNDGYKEYLSRLSKQKNYDEIVSLFENGLSLNAKIFLSGLYHDKK